MPEPPIPSTTMLRIGSAFGNASACTAAAASCAAASCSGSPATAPRKFRESTLMVALATSSVRNPPRGRSPLRSRLFEVGLHAVGGGLRREPCVLRVVDGVGVVDQEVGDVAVEHAVTPLEARVVERVLVGEVQERALVVGAREDLEQLGVERHDAPPFFDGRRKLLAAYAGQHLGGVRVAR